MSRVAQAFDTPPAKLFGSASLRTAVLAGMLAPSLLLLAGCGAGGFSFADADIDKAVVTSSVASSSSTENPSLAADQATIRNAVSAADVETQAGKELAWANSETGSRGAIMNLAEAKAGGRLCRRFTATRESFDGVALYKGEACVIGNGAWRLESFSGVPDSAAATPTGTGISS